MKTYNKYATQAITTKYLPCTNYKPSRIKAECSRGSVTVSYPHELSGAACHAYAADMLLKSFAEKDGNDKSWGTLDNYAIGALPESNKSGYVFVNVAR